MLRRILVGLVLAVVVACAAVTTSHRSSLSSDLKKAGAEGQETLELCVYRLLQAYVPEREAFEMCRPLMADVSGIADRGGEIAPQGGQRRHVTGQQLKDAADGVRNACANEGMGGSTAPREGDGGTPIRDVVGPKGTVWTCTGGVCVSIGKPEPKPDPPPPPPKDGGSRISEDGVSHACAAALETAMGLLNGCSSVDWVSGGCADLSKRVGECPDPDLIYVDPDAGYVCGKEPDAATVQAAVDTWCSKAPQVDGKSCTRPELQMGQHFYEVLNAKGICSSPYALTDGEVCASAFAIPPGGPDPSGGVGPGPAPPARDAWNGYSLWFVKDVSGSARLMSRPGPNPPPPGAGRLP